ncbi:hypothetical protein [Bordetella pseudohinzii]|uniref:Uncharacterized protein n=1 Tax=Bordetella pseudohinzii TaxID=1331258 RepID=A0A0J6C1E9_9BORD|nr:hypothetical protein [Bordetella pseudohinzii]ANY17237.1 hypothetical protein BBN53_15950 [Bordetella pseudohinzii]KMM24868.1 hypothetical protein L540_03305 [Bordetella pseudohinzii]CUI96830.1 Uncharacterised protein [Bordetella pseudohinzii]
MKYAKEVIDLLAAYPGRRFKMKQIINYVDPRADARQRAVLRTGVWRVLVALEESGQIGSNREEAAARVHVEYWWSVITTVPGGSCQEPSQYVRALAS